MRYVSTAAACDSRLALICAACGSSSSSTRTIAAATSRPFVWLKPTAVPAGWSRATISTGATIAYPLHWRRLESDPGTASAALRNGRGAFLGYLNATPRQGDETLTNWARFRVAHNKEEGDSKIHTIAAATNLRFRTGHGSCVQDSYATETHAHYIEIACIVAGRHATTVIVGAAPPGDWRDVSPLIQRSISAFET